MPFKTLLDLEQLKPHFHQPMADVARHFGVCTTFFKRICRTHGIKRWPYRKLQSLERRIEQLQRTSPAAHAGRIAELNASLAHLRGTGCPLQAESPSEDELPAEPLAADLEPTFEQASMKCYITEDREQEYGEEEELSGILAGLFRQTLGRYSISEAVSKPKEYERRLRQFDSYVNAAAYVFEMDPNGTPQFRYMSRGSYDVYGLTPDEVMAPDGCKKILSVIHQEDQASFVHTVQVSRTNLSEWEWCGRTLIPVGADSSVFKGNVYKRLHARSVPCKLEDGTVQWEGFLTQVDPRTHPTTSSLHGNVAAPSSSEPMSPRTESQNQALPEHVSQEC